MMCVVERRRHIPIRLKPVDNNDEDDDKDNATFFGWRRNATALLFGPSRKMGTGEEGKGRKEPSVHSNPMCSTKDVSVSVVEEEHGRKEDCPSSSRRSGSGRHETTSVLLEDNNNTVKQRNERDERRCLLNRRHQP